MKRNILFFCFIFGFGFLFGQQANIILNSPHNGNQSYLYEARDYISMGQNFSYLPVGNNFFLARINEDIVLPVDYAGDPINIEERILDYNLPVGTTAGSQSVSLSGAATYQIPLVIPPGTAGMEPGVSLVYSSQAGNGLLGYGWNLAGLSAISRAGHTIYHDSDIKGVDFNDDRFLLDGNRLIVTAGDYGAPLSEYYTETFNASKITAHGTAGGGPEYFIVETKDGKTIYYGNTPDSRFIAQGRTDVLVWNINRIQDRLGNYIEFEYHKEGQTQQWIKEIRYTGNGDMEPFNSIHFYYSERDDKQLTYIAGSKVEQKVILDKIKVFAAHNLVRKYSLKYHFDFYSHLIELKEFNSLGETYNSTVFEYFEMATQLDKQNITTLDPTFNYTYGDFTGDGKMDYVRVPNEIGPLDNYWELYANTGNGNFEFINSGTLVDEFLIMYNYQATIKFGRTSITGKFDGIRYRFVSSQGSSFDFNGDGYADLLWQETIVDPEIDYDVKYVYKIFDPVHNTFFGGSMGPSAKFDHDLRIGDFDGDNIMDIVVFNYENETWNMKSSLHGYKEGISTFWYSEGNVADYNGNGIMDIIVVSDTWCNIYEFNGQSFNTIYGGGFPTSCHDIFCGDFNGDGKSDLMTWVSEAGWEIHQFSGIGFIPMGNVPENLPQLHGNILIEPKVCVGDFNGDGKSDILHIDQHICPGVNINDFHLFYSNGLSFQYEEHEGVMLGNGHDDDWYTFGDFTGDGKINLKVSHSYYENAIYSFHSDEKRNMIKQIANGFNNISQFSYLPLTDNTVYKKNEYNSYGHNLLYFQVSDIQSPLYVVNTTINNDGINGETITTYFYEGAKMHNGGKGFLGFSSTIQSRELFGFVDPTWLEVVNNYELPESADGLEDYYFIVPKSTINQIKRDIEGGFEYEALSEVSYSYNYYDEYEASDLVFMPYLSQTIVVDKQKDDLTITTDYVVDDVGNIEIETTDYNGEGSATATTTYAQNGSWCKYLPDYVTTTQIRGNEAPFITETDYVYDNNGLLQTKMLFNNLPLPVSEIYTYDDFGNLTSVSTEPTGEMVPRVISYGYDSKGRFSTSKTNILGQESVFTYDDKTGNILTSTDIQYLTTTYQFDGFGRNIKTTFPDGNKSYNSIHWFTQNPGGNILYYTENITDGAPMQRTYFDELGRECIGASQHYNTNMVCRMTNYNANGKIESVSEPYFERAVPTQWTTYEYDELGRPAEISYPASTVVYAYNETSTTVTNTSTGVSTSNTIDAFGLTVSATDPGGTIGYEYYSSGLPKIITAPDGSEFTMDYDDYGRQKELNDPDARLTTYDEYNGFGELKKQTDANGNVINTEYDDFGRPHIIWDSDGLETTNTYIETGNGLGQIASIQQNNGIGYNYQYDRFGRMVNEQEIIGGQSYETGYTYDNFGNTETITYPSGFAVYNTYNRGYLSEVYRTDNNTLLYSNPVYNVRGQLTDYDIGNGLHTHKGYDDYGFPNSIITGTIQGLTFNFNPSTGNLNLRSDNNFSLTENFGYNDALKNRLTNWAVGSHPYSASYQTNGNTAFKSDIGTYHYEYNMVGGTGGPHSVTKISDPIIIPDENNQVITYNAYNKVEQIQHQNQGYEYNITYGPQQARKKTEFKHNGNTLKTKYYINGYEKEASPGSNVREVHYISGGDGLLALYIIENGTGTLYYVQKDYLGSLYALTDETGSIATHNGQQQIFSFDPWGRRRNPTNWTFTGVPTEQLIDRGFTGHEHLDEFGVINMNGRMYDPLLCRMLSPDNYVQAPDNSQNFNRYSYCLNNPLIYTDPDGEFAFLVFAAYFLVNAAIDYGIQVAFNYTEGYSGKDAWLNKVDFADVVISGGIGGLTGGSSTAIKAGEKVGKVGMFMFKHPQLVTLGEITVTSGIDFTGEGWQPVGFDDFFKRVVVGAGTYYGTKALGKAFSKKAPSVEHKVNNTINDIKKNWTVNHEGDLDTYLRKKDWTLSEIQETLDIGQRTEHKGINYINPGNRLIRIENPFTKKSLIFDIDANQVIQLGKLGYLW